MEDEEIVDQLIQRTHQIGRIFDYSSIVESMNGTHLAVRHR